MITGVHHIAVIVSSAASIDFYSRLGFRVRETHERGYDTVVLMDGPCTLEIFVDPKHPARVTNPEAMGLRHLALKVDKIEDDLKGFEIEPIRTDWNGVRFTFIKDPDGLPIEIHEQKEQTL